jgi:ribosomal protein S18 acetylase RimI-like enzyme
MTEITTRRLTRADTPLVEALFDAALTKNAAAEAFSSIEDGSSNVMGAFRGDRLIAVLPYSLGADAAAQLGAPIVDPSAGSDSPRILASASRCIVSLGAEVVMTAVDPGSSFDECLALAGFALGPLMIRMSRMVLVGADAPEGPWRTYSPDDRAAFADVLYATLEGSLDAPELPIVRDGERLMRSFEERGEHSAEDFSLLMVDSVAAGIVLLAANDDAMEILYFGVVPSMRGRGCGRALIERAIERASRVGARTLDAFVDSRNVHAVDLYRRFAFSETRAVQVRYIDAKKNSKS